VCLHYFLFDRQAVQSALPYVQRRFPQVGTLKRYGYVYLLFVNLGKSLMDRFILTAGHEPFEITFRGVEILNDLLRREQGVILLTSHVGNWQAVMHALKNLEKRLQKDVYLLVRTEDNEAVRKTLRVEEGHSNIHCISTDEHLGGVIQMMKVLSEGQIVSLMGDRRFQSEAVEVTLLGETAYFPYSAFRIAAGARCPVAVLFSAKVNSTSYEVEIAKVIEPKMSRRGTMTERWGPSVQEYATALEGFLERYPLQNFVFEDIWKSPSAHDE
jgi:predicted LPLAT superfamily acyltransferase